MHISIAMSLNNIKGRSVPDVAYLHHGRNNVDLCCFCYIYIWGTLMNHTLPLQWSISPAQAPTVLGVRGRRGTHPFDQFDQFVHRMYQTLSRIGALPVGRGKLDSRVHFLQASCVCV